MVWVGMEFRCEGAGRKGAGKGAGEREPGGREPGERELIERELVERNLEREGGTGKHESRVQGPKLLSSTITPLSLFHPFYPLIPSSQT